MYAEVRVREESNSDEASHQNFSELERIILATIIYPIEYVLERNYIRVLNIISNLEGGCVLGLSILRAYGIVMDTGGIPTRDAQDT